MLNLLKKKQTSVYKYLNKDINLTNNDKPLQFSPSWKEWKTSIYSYNKEYIKLLVYKDKLVNYLFKSYFNLTKKIFNVKRLSFNHKRFSSNRIYLSEAEIKHTNSNVNITLFIFNKNKNFMKYKLIGLQKQFYKLRKLNLNIMDDKNKQLFIFNVKRFKYSLYFLMNNIFKNIKKNVIIRMTYLLNLSKYDKISILQYNKLLQLIKRNAILEEKKENFWRNFYLNYLNKKIYTIKKRKNILISKYKNKSNILAKNLTSSFLTKVKTDNLINETLITIKKNNIINETLLNKDLSKLKYKNKVKKYLKFYDFLYYYQLLVFNKNLFTNWFLNYRGFGIINIISKIYNKKVEFNIVSLKSMHLNSDIYSQAIALKLKNRNNKLLSILRKALFKIKLPRLFDLYTNDNINKNITRKKDMLNSIKYKIISGVRFEASGRLTKRLIASRALFKFRYVGSLRNIYSSYIGLSSALLRGYLKSNLEYTLINSKTRNGSFGLKGWTGSY